MASRLFFSKYFEIDDDILTNYGALDICLEADLPLFIDPFLLFASEKPEYVKQHDLIVNHLVALKDLAISNPDAPNIKFQFSEIPNNWLGLSKYGNKGKGLGKKFAINLKIAFNGFYKNFGDETASSSTHIEKLTLVNKGIGRDFISDFSTNLIFEFLLEFTETFALSYLKDSQRRKFNIRCKRNTRLGTLDPREFVLPYFHKIGDEPEFILLTPLDILTKDDAFISHSDMSSNFQQVVAAMDNENLRYAINAFFAKLLPIIL